MTGLLSAANIRQIHYRESQSIDIDTLPSDEPKISLRLEDLHLLNERLIANYSDFVTKAPLSWRADGFLESHLPCSITSAYGQDQRICQSDTLVVEAGTWNAERHYDKLHFVSVALVTDIRCFKP
jgi:hypothetical protein